MTHLPFGKAVASLFTKKPRCFGPTECGKYQCHEYADTFAVNQTLFLLFKGFLPGESTLRQVADLMVCENGRHTEDERERHVQQLLQGVEQLHHRIRSIGEVEGRCEVAASEPNEWNDSSDVFRMTKRRRVSSAEQDCVEKMSKIPEGQTPKTPSSPCDSRSTKSRKRPRGGSSEGMRRSSAPPTFLSSTPILEKTRTQSPPSTTSSSGSSRTLVGSADESSSPLPTVAESTESSPRRVEIARVVDEWPQVDSNTRYIGEGKNQNSNTTPSTRLAASSIHNDIRCLMSKNENSPPKPFPGFVYVVVDRAQPACWAKIGRTKNPPAREFTRKSNKVTEIDWVYQTGKQIAHSSRAERIAQVSLKDFLAITERVSDVQYIGQGGQGQVLKAYKHELFDLREETAVKAVQWATKFVEHAYFSNRRELKPWWDAQVKGYSYTAPENETVDQRMDRWSAWVDDKIKKDPGLTNWDDVWHQGSFTGHCLLTVGCLLLKLIGCFANSFAVALICSDGVRLLLMIILAVGYYFFPRRMILVGQTSRSIACDLIQGNRKKPNAVL